MTVGNDILSTGERLTFKQGETVFSQNDEGNNMYVVLKGLIGVYINSFDEFPLRIAEVLPGGFVGEMSVIDGSRRSATIVAEEETVLLSVKKDDFPQLLNERPDITMIIMKSLCKRLRSLNDRIIELNAIRNKTHPLANIFEKLQDIIPKHWKNYDINETDKFSKYINVKFITCPVCNMRFQAKVPYYSMIKTKYFTSEFRRICLDFDTIWYEILVCDNCGYANFYSQFNSITDDQIDMLMNAGYSKHMKNFTQFFKMRSINQVIKSYYAAVLCNMTIANDSLQLAKMWLRIYWLFSDADDMDMKEKALAQALDHFIAVCDGDYNYIDPRNAVQIYAVTAGLCLSANDKANAIKYYKQVLITDNNSKSMYHERAGLALLDLGVSKDEIYNLENKKRNKR